MGDILDDAAAKPLSQQSQQSAPSLSTPSTTAIDDGDILDQAAARPIQYPPDLGPSKQPNTDLGIPKITPAVIPGVIAGAGKAGWETLNKAADAVLGGRSGRDGGPTPLAQTLGVNEEINPPSTPEGLGENLGSMAEQGAEFALGDFLTKDLSLGEKFSEMGKIWKTLELHPRAKEALKLGMQAMRQGAVGGATALTHGATPEDASKMALFAGAAGFGAGEVYDLSSALGRRFTGARENSYIQTPEDYVIRAFNPTEEVNLPKAGMDDRVREFAKFDQEFKANAPYILGTAERTGLHPVGRKSMIDVTLRTADEFHDLWNNRILGPLENQKVGVFDGYHGRQENGFASLRDLDTRLNIINDTLSPRYEAGKGGVTAEAKVGADQATELRTEAAQLRKLLYGTLQQGVGDRIGVNVSEVKARNGQLRDLADNMSRQWQKQRVRGMEPVGDSSTVRSASEKALVRTARSVLGDPRDADIRRGWDLLRNDLEPMAVGEMGPSVPPPKTNSFVSRSHIVKINPDNPTEFTWGKSTPEEIQAHQDRISARVERNRVANELAKAKADKAAKQAAARMSSHGPSRGESDATGEP